MDLTGDKIHEALVEYRPRSNKGSDDTFSVFAYQKGAVKQILSIREYGLTKCTYYTKTKSLILYGTGRGGEWHRYFQINGTRYKDIVQRIRKSTAGGGTEYGPWQYTMGKSKTKITKAKFISAEEDSAEGNEKNPILLEEALLREIEVIPKRLYRNLFVSAKPFFAACVNLVYRELCPGSIF